MTTPLVVGNWKMNGGPAACLELARAVVQGVRQQRTSAQIALAPPFTALQPIKKAIAKSPIQLAAQNSHWQDSGAFTGEISPVMLAEIGCEFVIIGHSERRHLLGETDEAIAKKLHAVLRHGMRPILCVGETIEDRQNDRTREVITRQIDSALKGISEGAIENVEIAYEPVWAIGTGLNASAAQIDETHRQIRERLNTLVGSARGQQVRILYGGSVKPDNASMIAAIDAVNGLLVGGASLMADSFLTIASAFSSN
jgi:triosephosphate isomerase (TIM)